MSSFSIHLLVIFLDVIKQNADSTYNLRIPLMVADSQTAQFNDTNVLSFVCGFHKLFWIPQIQLRTPQFRLFFEQF